MYEIYCKLRDARGVRDADVIKATGITKSTFSEWKNGAYKPKREKLSKLADYFGVTIEYIETGDPDKMYYFNDSAAKEAQALFENRGMRMLFDAAKDVGPEGLRIATDMLRAMKQSENGGDNN